MQLTKEENKAPQTIPEALARFERIEHIALICGDEELSYRELISDAKRIAHALVERGVQKGDRVVLEMSRSADYVRMYLGVIYAGAIQVTPHSGWPEHQRSMVYSDCTPVLIVDDAMAAELKTAPLTGEVRPLPVLNGSDPFQIVYTSGSTGRPKGVVLHHLMAVNRILRTDENSYSFFFRTHCQRKLLYCNPGFVLFSFDLFLALMNGKTVVLVQDQDALTPESLAGYAQAHSVDAVCTSPSYYLQCRNVPAFTKLLSHLKLLLIGSEAIPAHAAPQMKASVGGELVFTYGSSEVFGPFLFLLGSRYRGGEVAFQTPSSGEVALVLNAQGQSAKPGEPGELCIGGIPGVLGCYWNDSKLTAERFRSHPLYGRLYWTGDTAELTEDGFLRILGRKDSMLKLHGIRIETAAIEDAMGSFPGVFRAAVKIQGEGADAVLCGYYSGTVDEGALRRSLAEALPYYMVPSFLRELPELPLNLNGKLDRKALPPVQFSKGNYVPPETKEERMLCEAFRTVLRQESPVGIDDSFFELGGDSIRGIMICTLLREQGYESRVEWIFAAPTPRALAQMLRPLAPEKNMDQPFWSVELSEAERSFMDQTIGRERVETIYPILAGIREHLYWNAPFWIISAFLLPNGTTPLILRERLAESVRCHQVLRTVIVVSDKCSPLQVVLKDWEIPLFTVDLRSLAGSVNGSSGLSAAQEQYLWNLSELYQQKPMSSSDVMFEAVFIRMSEKQSVLFLAGSHLLLDGTGFRRIQEELVLGIPIVSDAQQYNRIVRRMSSSEFQEEALHAWRKHLAGKHRLTVLPLVSGKAEDCARTLIAGNTFAENIDALCRKTHVTLTAVTCLALGRALMALCDTEQVCFLSTANGRNEESSHLTGMFTACFPIYVSKEDKLFSVQEQLVRAAGLPIPEPELFAAGPDQLVPDGCVCLSMQNYRHSDTLQDLYQQLMTPRRSHSSLKRGGMSAPKQLGVAVSPYAPFRITLTYSHACFADAFVDRFGRRFLRELRRIVEEESIPVMPETGG